jgi:cell division inhibitor SepF
MSLWKRTMDYLGLGPDDAYDDDIIEDDYEPAPRGRRPPEPDPRGGRSAEPAGSDGVVRTLPSRPTFPSRDFDPSQARRSAGSDDSGVNPRPKQPSNRGAAASNEPTTVRPRRFDQAQEVADRFKEGNPVIMNLEGADREVARRLIDFASGLCYGLDGSMEKVANGVYLLKPAAARALRDDYDD